MYRVTVLLACLALCQGHAVVPVLPAHWGFHAVPLSLAPYPVLHQELYGHGYTKPLVHHVLKRSPHLVAPVAHVAPVAVSHQYRHDVHAAVVPVAKPVIAGPPLPFAPLLHNSVYPVPYGPGYGLHHGSLYPYHY